MRVRHPAVFVSAVLTWLLGALWYGPLFSRPWLAALGKTAADLERQKAHMGVAPFVVAFLAPLVMGYVLAWLLSLTRYTVSNGVRAAILLWLPILGATATQYSFAQLPLSLLAIDSGYALAGLLISGLVIGAWSPSPPASSLAPRPR